MTSASEELLQSLFDLQPKEALTEGSAIASKDETVIQQIEDLLDKIPEPFNVREMLSRSEDLTPYMIVSFQECDRMNILIGEVKRNLNELFDGLKGILTISSGMEELMDAIFFDKVPQPWKTLSYPSQMGLQSWFADLILRFQELGAWVSDTALPKTIWLGGLFNPQSFLTAIMQQTARKNQWPLDRMCLNCEITKKFKQEISATPREGANIHGLFLEGARWCMRSNSIADSLPKELFPIMPVMYVVAVTQDKRDVRDVYECPLYRNRMRGSSYVWTFNLKTKQPSSKWTLAGVCMLLQK